MSLAERFNRPRIHAETRRQVRIMTLDIERVPGTAAVQHRGLTITGDFWDLSGWKHVIGRRIHADDVTAWPQTICAAAKWYDARPVMFSAVWDEGGAEAFMRTVWEWYDEADIVVGHNLQAFDSKHLKAAWAEYGWAPPSPWKTIDTLKIARAEFAFESNTLDALCKRLGVVAKTDKYDVRTALAAVGGDAAAQRKIKLYNQGDVRASEALYDRLRPHIKNHPHLSMFTGNEWGCPNCGETNLSTNDSGTAYTNVQRYRAYVCPRCGTHVRGNRRMQDPTQTRTYR